MAFPGMPGGMPGGGAPFDFASLQQALNDPSIKQMAEQIANDPTFKDMTASLQESFAGAMGPGGAGAAAMPDPSQFDPNKYMQAMSGMFQNPGFMQMAEKLGKAIISADPGMASMMQTMQDPSYRAKVEEQLKSLKGDPELGPMLEEIESAGPMAMMKYWNDPEVIAKLGKAMGGAFEGMPPGVLPEGDEEGEEGAEEGEEAAEEDTVHGAASAGSVDALKALLEGGASPDETDEEGRTALHFACGYGELECAKLLIQHKAKLDLVDNNKNTALHYAAGYGQGDAVKLLLDSGVDDKALNLDGKTALEVAQLNDQAEVAKIIEEHTKSAQA